jgi:hypothetical protein
MPICFVQFIYVMSNLCRVYTTWYRPVVSIRTTKLEIKNLYFLPA